MLHFPLSLPVMVAPAVHCSPGTLLAQAGSILPPNSPWMPAPLKNDPSSLLVPDDGRSLTDRLNCLPTPNATVTSPVFGSQVIAPPQPANRLKVMGLLVEPGGSTCTGRARLAEGRLPPASKPTPR